MSEPTGRGESGKVLLAKSKDDYRVWVCSKNKQGTAERLEGHLLALELSGPATARGARPRAPS